MRENFSIIVDWFRVLLLIINLKSFDFLFIFLLFFWTCRNVKEKNSMFDFWFWFSVFVAPPSLVIQPTNTSIMQIDELLSICTTSGQPDKNCSLRENASDFLMWPGTIQCCTSALHRTSSGLCQYYSELTCFVSIGVTKRFWFLSGMLYGLTLWQ